MLRSAYSAARSPLAWVLFLVPALGGLSLDLYTKAYAFSHLQPVEQFDVTDPRPREVVYIKDYLHFVAHENRGAVFGLGQGQRPLFLVVSAVAVGMLVYLFVRSGRQRLYAFVLGLLMAGVLGNLYDRAALGHVRDMIYALPGITIGTADNPKPIFPWVFNIADSCLCVGVFLMLCLNLFARRPAAETPVTRAAPAPDSIRTEPLDPATPDLATPDLATPDPATPDLATPEPATPSNTV